MSQTEIFNIKVEIYLMEILHRFLSKFAKFSRQKIIFKKIHASPIIKSSKYLQFTQGKTAIQYPSTPKFYLTNDTAPTNKISFNVLVHTNIYTRETMTSNSLTNQHSQTESNMFSYCLPKNDDIIDIKILLGIFHLLF